MLSKSAMARLGAALTGGLMLCVVSAAQAVPTLVTSRAVLAGDDFFDWGQLGAAYATVANPSNVLSNGGITGTVSKPPGSMERRNQGSGGWGGNFANGDKLLWTRYAPGPLTIDLGTGVAAAGAQIQRNSYGAFTGVVSAFDSLLNLIASFNVAGTSNGNINTAIFMGIQTTAGDPLISRLTFNVTGNKDFAINQFDIVTAALPPAAVPEPGTLALFGLGLAGLGFARRRRMI